MDWKWDLFVYLSLSLSFFSMHACVCVHESAKPTRVREGAIYGGWVIDATLFDGRSNSVSPFDVSYVVLHPFERLNVWTWARERCQQRGGGERGRRDVAAADGGGAVMHSSESDVKQKKTLLRRVLYVLATSIFRVFHYTDICSCVVVIKKFLIWSKAKKNEIELNWIFLERIFLKLYFFVSFCVVLQSTNRWLPPPQIIFGNPLDLAL